MRKNREVRKSVAAPSNWEELSRETLRDRRREQRLALAYPIDVCGLDLKEQFFTEETVTSSVSVSGCRFRLQTMLSPDTTVALKRVNRETVQATSGKALLFQIDWTTCEKGGWTCGAHALHKENIWDISFPEELIPAFPQA